MGTKESDAAKKTLKAGIAKTDVTPSESLWLGGYNLRETTSEGVSGPIFIRALIFEGGNERIAFVACDAVMLPDNDEMRRSVGKATGINPDRIFLQNVHNHSSPIIGGKNADSEYSHTYTDRITETVKAALEDLEPVMVGAGTGCSFIAMNRRKMIEEEVSAPTTFDENHHSQNSGKYKTDKPKLIRELPGVFRLGPNADGPIDESVGVIRIDTLEGKPKAVLVNYACHGTSLGGRNQKIDPEWNGHMLLHLEEKIPGLQGIFLNGACGDINPRVSGGMYGYKDDPLKTRELGREIAREVLRVYENIEPVNLEDATINICKEDIYCPKRYIALFDDPFETCIKVPTWGIRIKDFTFVTFPGELFHRIGKAVKASCHNRFSFLVGYTNGSVGYLPTQDAYCEGGYEPAVTKFAPPSEKIYLREVKKLLRNLY